MSMGHILIAHESKVVRATLTKHLDSCLHIIEAPEGDSAWQTLVLDHNIKGIVAEPDLPRLSGFDLLERLRASRLQRLRKMPFYFIGSETKIAEIQDKALELGATGCIDNNTDRVGIMLALQQVLEQKEDPKSEGGKKAQLRATSLLSAPLFKEELGKALSASDEQSSVLLFGVSGYSELVDDLGKSVARRIVEQFASLLQTKIGRDDFIGRHGPGCFAIASRGTCLAQCAVFAQRVLKSVEAAKIVVRGRSVRFSVNVGAASRPEDGKISAVELLALGEQRMKSAMASGPGKIVICGGG